MASRPVNSGSSPVTTHSSLKTHKIDGLIRMLGGMLGYAYVVHATQKGGKIAAPPGAI